jgi:SAM-dependent methyltransferase
MRVEEAECIRTLVASVDMVPGVVCLNIGSSTKHFREIEQPHIGAKLIRPLEDAGVRFVHCDLKDADGVDLVGNVLDAGFQQRMAENQADVLLCCNILEHLSDPQAFSDACAELVKPCGYMVVSVPLSYPYHPDPIDTMLRATPVELANFFSGWEIVRAEVVRSQTFLHEVLAKPRGVSTLILHILKVIFPIYRPTRWWEKTHRLMWLFRPYTVSVVLLRKPAVRRPPGN